MKPRTAQTRIAESWPRHRYKRRKQQIARVKKRAVKYRPERKPVMPWWRPATPDERKPQ